MNNLDLPQSLIQSLFLKYFKLVLLTIARIHLLSHLQIHLPKQPNLDNKDNH